MLEDDRVILDIVVEATGAVGLGVLCVEASMNDLGVITELGARA